MGPLLTVQPHPGQQVHWQPSSDRLQRNAWSLERCLSSLPYVSSMRRWLKYDVKAGWCSVRIHSSASLGKHAWPEDHFEASGERMFLLPHWNLRLNSTSRIHWTSAKQLDSKPSNDRSADGNDTQFNGIELLRFEVHARKVPQVLASLVLFM